MKLTRRGFLITSAGSAAVVAFTPGCFGPARPFRHGVASGDPLSDGVILWTRVTKDGSPNSIAVEWQLALDPAMNQIVQSGNVSALRAFDYTVKVDVTGLAAGQTYYYQFHALGWDSPVGRTKTFPVGAIERARFALVSCINYPYGFFNGYGGIARRPDIDAVICLGDYYYEYANLEYGDGTAINRIPDPGFETLTLADYRRRHAQYKTDPQLQELHRQFPFISIWDDHEFADNTWSEGAGNHDPMTEGAWTARRNAAVQAYYDWMPIRQAHADPHKIFRRFQYGDLLDLILLDTRLIARDEQAADFDTATMEDPSRHLIGTEQEEFLRDSLTDSRDRGAIWRLLGQQVILSHMQVNVEELPGIVINPDQWDGYVGARNRVFDIIEEESIDNLVTLTGDVHSSWAFEVSRNPYDDEVYDPVTSEGALAVEFVCPAITSPGIEDANLAAAAEGTQYLSQPHLRFVDLFHRGYVILDIDEGRLQAEWYHNPQVRQPSPDEFFARGFRVDSGTNQLVEVFTPSMAARAPRPAPDSLLTAWLKGERKAKLDLA